MAGYLLAYTLVWASPPSTPRSQGTTKTTSTMRSDSCIREVVCSSFVCFIQSDCCVPGCVCCGLLCRRSRRRPDSCILGWLPRVLGSCLLRFALSLWVGLLCVPGGCLLRFALSHACCGFACALVGCLLGLSVSLYNCKLHGAFCQGFSSVRSWLRLVDQISLALVSPCGPYVPFNPEALLCAKGDLAFVCICAVVLIDLASCVRYV